MEERVRQNSVEGSLRRKHGAGFKCMRVCKPVAETWGQETLRGCSAEDSRGPGPLALPPQPHGRCFNSVAAIIPPGPCTNPAGVPSSPHFTEEEAKVGAVKFLACGHKAGRNGPRIYILGIPYLRDRRPARALLTCTKLCEQKGPVSRTRAASLKKHLS